MKADLNWLALEIHKMREYLQQSFCKNERFYSKYLCKNSSGGNAFAYTWEDEILWLVPPSRLISNVLLHAKISNAKGLLIVPRWESATFWPLLWDGCKWSDGLHLLIEYKRPNNLFERSPFGNSVFCEEQFTSNVLVFEINFS